MDLDWATFLRIASCSGLESETQMALRNGADPNMRCGDEGVPVLHLASRSNNPKVVRLLLEAGAQIDALDPNGSSALCQCAELGHWGAANVLVEEGADAYLADAMGRNPLHHAAINGAQFMAAPLIRAGSEIDLRDRSGVSPIVYSAQRGHARMFRALLRMGAEPNGLDPAAMNDEIRRLYSAWRASRAIEGE
jgi:ankyrin repeat protein